MDLHTAARNGDKQRMLQLIGLQTDLNTRDKHARTALHLAAWAGQEVRSDLDLSGVHRIGEPS
jgi:ankyrin repeat protein